MKRIFRLTALTGAAWVLAGCASVNFDQALQDTNDTNNTFTQGKLELSRTEQQAQARTKLSSELLAKPLGMDEAVQLALANSPAVQTLLAQSWADMVKANQTGRIAKRPDSSDTNHSKLAIEMDRPATTEHPEQRASPATMPKLS